MQNRQLILTTMLLTLGCFGLCPLARALTPPPDGGYPGGNTAEGQNALGGSAIGAYNTAIGFLSLASLSDASFNTGVGAGTLFASIGEENTATGAGALLSNTTGGDNTADGVFALSGNTQGHDNTANGDYALFGNTTGSNNTGLGRVALYSNTIGSNNTAVGSFAGHDLTTGDNNIDIGYNVVGVAAEANTIRIGNTDITDAFIRGISGATSSGGAAVFVNSNGHLGTVTSSARFKQDIRPMDKASEAILALNPVSFRYKRKIDPQGIAQFGLVAEEVEKVNPDLVIRDAEGRPQTVRYEQINAMLLNEFLKAHHKIEEQEAIITQLRKAMETVVTHAKEQDSRIQKVSDQIEMNKARPGVVRNNPRRTESDTSPQ